MPRRVATRFLASNIRAHPGFESEFELLYLGKEAHLVFQGAATVRRSYLQPTIGSRHAPRRSQPFSPTSFESPSPATIWASTSYTIETLPRCSQGRENTNLQARLLSQLPTVCHNYLQPPQLLCPLSPSRSMTAYLPLPCCEHLLRM
jgi:hypothetical protein